MDTQRDEHEKTFGLSEGKATANKDDTLAKERIRKPKKPEIQIYRPGALRHKRSNQSNNQPAQETRDQVITKSVDTKEDVHRPESEKKTLIQPKQGSSQEKKIVKGLRDGEKVSLLERKSSMGDKGEDKKTKETDKQSSREGREVISEDNVGKNKKNIIEKEHFREEPQASEYLSKEKQKSGYKTCEERAVTTGKNTSPTDHQKGTSKTISTLKNVGNNSRKDVKGVYDKTVKKQEERLPSPEKSISTLPGTEHVEKGNSTVIDTINAEYCERHPYWKWLKEQNTTSASGRKTNKHASEKSPLKKYGEGFWDVPSDVKSGVSGHEESVIGRVQPDVSSSQLKKRSVPLHHERLRSDKIGKDYNDWKRVHNDSKGEDGIPVKRNEKNEKYNYDKPLSRRGSGMTELNKSTGVIGNVDDKISLKSTGATKQHKKSRSYGGTAKSDSNYKGNYDPQSLRKEIPKGKRNSYYNSEFFSSKSPVMKLDSGSGQPGECHNNKEENQITVSELAAKVDELAVGNLSRKAGNLRRKGKGWHDGLSDVKVEHKGGLSKGEDLTKDVNKGVKLKESLNKSKDLKGGVSKDLHMEERHSDGHLQPSDNTNPVERIDSKCCGPNSVPPEYGEKSSRAKSYTSVRENRRNRAGNKSLSQGAIPCNQRGDLKIEVTVDKNSHERTAHLRQVSGSDAEESENRSQTGQGVFNRSKSETFSQSSPKIKSLRRGKADIINLQEDRYSSGGNESEQEVVDPMIFIDVPEDDWVEEVDRDTTWCNQHEGEVKAPTWEDEKPSWRNKREKHQSESEDHQKRVESPGRRGGLIQLSVTGTSNTASETSASHQITSTPQLQKHLYNPNNPSKPVAVVPSARDLPASRESHREGSRGFGDNPSGSQPMDCSNISEYTIEGRSPKIDPSILYSIQKGEMDINYYVSSNQLPVEFRRIMDIRRHLQGCYKQLLISDIRMCQEKNMENSLWKTLYYVIIEKLREYISRDPSLKDRSLSTLLMLVDEGQHYLQDLLDALQLEYGFTLEDHLEDEGTPHLEIRGRVRMALMSTQKLLLSLGDLARYREQYSPSPNFSLAKKWYQMALQVHPRNGRPFNQLAIIAVNQKRPLDVVYYYVRSLTASNPFMSARDSLVSMFDDIRKKYIAAQHNEPHPEGTRANVGRSLSGEGLRQEIWIRPDSGATYRRTLSQSTADEGKDEDDELKKMPLEQLMKRFLTSYLHCHGMLFSRVGLDGFRTCCLTMLREFSVLLRSSPPRLSTNHLLQIMAINMYAVGNTELKDSRVGSGYRSAAQELALVIAQEMFGRLVELVVELLPHHVHHQQYPPPSHQHTQPPAGVDPQRLFSPTLAYFMPPLKAWCDWLLYNSSVWNPPPASHEYNTQAGVDTWSSVAELATIMRGFGTPDTTLTEGVLGGGDLGGGVPIKLTEDTFLRGYEPLLAAHKNLMYTASDGHTGRACDWIRVVTLQTVLCQFLCGVDPPVLRLQKTDHGDVLVSIVNTSPPDTPTTTRLSLSTSDVEVEDSLSESDTSEVEDEIEAEAGEDDTPLASTVRLLTIRKKALEKKQRQQRKLQTLLEGSVTLEMEVRPRYLVPDTNCFIEHLDVVQSLATSAPYTVMVPLVVLTELDGLSRDAAVAKYGSVGHAVRVREGAAAALHYLRETKPQSLKCVTSQGSVLSSTTFTAEMDMPDATNDDKILSCCVHFCSDTTQRRPIKAGVRRLYREVVLLTEDRNLRVKAHARDVPVRDLLDFAHWAGVR